jgi:hypothetical protein
VIGSSTGKTFPDIDAAVNGKESSITAGTTFQCWRGDKSRTLDKAAVGLGNMDNTSDANKSKASVTVGQDAYGISHMFKVTDTSNATAKIQEAIDFTNTMILNC